MNRREQISTSFILLAFIRIVLFNFEESQLKPFDYSFFNEYQYQPQTKSLSSSLSSDFTSLTLGPVIKFNQVNESMNQSMTNSTQLNFKNQVKIKLQVKFELTLVIVKRLNMVKLLTVHCSASHERRVLTPNSRSY